MEINYILILGAGIISMIVGSIWYGPLFGKKWMEICGVSAMDEEKRKQMQKEAMPLYVVQFLLSLLQFVILESFLYAYYRYVNLIGSCVEQGDGCFDMKKIYLFGSILVWLGFVMPTVAGSAMWNNDSSKVKWARFLIQAGYQLVMFIIFGWMIATFG